MTVSLTPLTVKKQSPFNVFSSTFSIKHQDYWKSYRVQNLDLKNHDVNLLPTTTQLSFVLSLRERTHSNMPARLVQSRQSTLDAFKWASPNLCCLALPQTHIWCLTNAWCSMVDGRCQNTEGDDFGCRMFPHVVNTGIETGNMLSFFGPPQAPTENSK